MKPLVSWEAAHGPKAPKPRTPVKKINQQRGSARFPKNAIPELREFIRKRPCVLEALNQCRGPVEVAHVKSRGSGGPDWDNVISLCMEHHREQHRIGRPRSSSSAASVWLPWRS